MIVFCLLALVMTAAELKPFKSTLQANTLIIRGRFKEKIDFSKLPVIRYSLKDGQFQHQGELRVINPVTGSREIDFELPFGENKELSEKCQILISGYPDGMEIYEVRPVLFKADDLSNGLDFETIDNCGVWGANLGGKAEWENTRGFRGKGSMKAVWLAHQMVSLLPGTRDWSPYAELRFVVTNPLPTEQGRRNRNMFLFDGQTVHRPTIMDSIPHGNLDLYQESSKVFKLDLIKLKKNNPKINLRNIMSVQFFWSSTAVTGETVFYFDDMKLLTAEELEQEKAAIYLDKFAELKKMAPKIKRDNWNGEIEKLHKRFAGGERESLESDITTLKEKMVNAVILGDNDIKVVAVPPTEKIMRDTIFEYREFPVTISAAGNERESFQLALALSRPLKKVLVTPNDLRSSAGDVIPADCIRINPVGYVEVTEAFYYPSSRPGLWPDILHQNRPFDLSERVQPFMVTVAVPDGQKADIYEGNLAVTAEGMEPRTISYRLRVYNFSLPTRGKAKTFISFNYAPENPELRRKVYDLAFDYRLNPTCMYPKIYKKDINTRFLPYPEDIPYCLEKGMNFMTFGFMEDQQAKDHFAFDEEYIQALLRWIGKWKPILEKADAWDMAYLLGFDEIMHQPAPIRNKRLKSAEKICQAIKKAYPDCKIANIGKLMKISPDLMDKWYNIPMQRKEFSQLLNQGKEVAFYWAYEDPSFMLDLPGTASRICSWMAYKEGADGIGYYSSCRFHGAWTDKNRPSREQIATAHNKDRGFSLCGENCQPDMPLASLDWDKEHYQVQTNKKYGRNADGLLFHPAPDRSLLASFRLVSIRDGIEDYEYLKILEECSGGKHPLLKIPDTLVTTGSYTRNYDAIQAYREKIAEAIQSALTAKGSHRSLQGHP